MEAVGRLAGGIAHDFNNILAGVFAYGEMVLDEAPRDSPLQRYAQNVLIAAIRGRDLVKQILSYSHSQSGIRTPVDVVHVLKETIELIRGSLPAGIRLEASTPESPLIVQSDATQLHRVVMNLCSNAIQAMRAGGILRVLLETEDLSGERVLSHGTLGSGRYLRLIVEDSGSGMEEPTLARIFEPFFTTKEVGKGTGLGLSLVYAIIADSEGAIDVKSLPQQGSTFTIYLPRSQIMLAAGEAGASALPRGHGERVLLIGDEGPMLAASAELLSQLGYEAVSFSDGSAALAAFDAAPERFDAVVTDEILPGLTGTRLAGLVRQRRPGLPVVLVSGRGGASLLQDALAAGLSEWLTKPLQARDTATTLARVLHR
jgi:CheY-like chemotaxis protein